MGDATGADTRFRSAIDVAGKLGRTPQLRAATRLSRRGRTDDVELLHGVYETFDEGFESPDLKVARAVLDGVDARVG